MGALTAASPAASVASLASATRLAEEDDSAGAFGPQTVVTYNFSEYVLTYHNENT